MRKLLSVLLVAAMVLGLVGTAFAASYPDIAGDKYASAILKVSQLGVFTGDERGFRPNDTIKRSEFAAVVVRTLGLEDAAKALAGSPTKFVDVPASHWASGYINIAAAKGIVQGVGGNLFNPDAPVTMAEVVTMLVRAMGREADAVGQWPVGHIMVASQIGLMNGITFVKDQPARRDEVAKFVANGLTVKFKAPNAEGVLQETNDTFLSLLGYTRITGTVTKVDTVNNKITVGGTEYTLSGAEFSGAAFKDLVGHNVEMLQNVSTSKVNFVGVTNTSSVTGKITAYSAADGTVTVNGTVYTVADDAIVTLNGNAILGDAAAKVVELKDADASIVLDSTGKAIQLTCYRYDVTGTVAKKTTEYVAGSTKNKIEVNLTGGGTGVYTFTSSTTVVRNGAAATYDAIAVGDDVRIALANTTTNTIKSIDAYAMTVTGKVVAVTLTTGARSITLKVNGVDTVYNAAYTSSGALKTPGLFEGLTIGQEAKLTLDRDGKVVTCTQSSASWTAGTVKTVASTSDTYDSNGRVRTLTLTDGTVYKVSETVSVSRNSKISDFYKIKAGDLIADLSLTNGVVTNIVALAPKVTSWQIVAKDGSGLVVLENPASGERIFAVEDSAARYSLNGLYASETNAINSGNYVTATFNGGYADYTLAATGTSGQTTVTFTGGVSTNDAYNGVSFTVGGQTYTITDYDGSTGTATVTPTLAANISGNVSLGKKLTAVSFDAVQYDVENGHIVAKFNNGTDNFIRVAVGTAYDPAASATYKEYKVTSSTVITLDGAAKTYGDLAIGQLVSVAKASANNNAVQIDASTDTDAAVTGVAKAYGTGHTSIVLTYNAATQTYSCAAGDEVTIKYQSTEDAYVTIKVFSGSTVVKTLAEDVFIPGNPDADADGDGVLTADEVANSSPATVTWDGRLGTNQWAAAGTYTIVVYATDYAGNTSAPVSTTVQVTVQ